jgi:ABC transport system ATP-binding/permease protein
MEIQQHSSGPAHRSLVSEEGMASLLSAKNLSLQLGSRSLFSELNFGVDEGVRIGLIGPNGAGKSSLLKILLGSLAPTSGDVARRRGLKLAYLPQVPEFKPGLTVREVLMSGTKFPDEWEAIALAEEVANRLSLQEYLESPVSELSGGWRKRVAIAREWMGQPDLFLLDEPTNHLDVESVLWLEEWIQAAPFATVTVTHDRYFLDRAANTIFELDRRNPNGLLVVPGGYSQYLEKKNELMGQQVKLEERLKNTLRRETEWVRRGAKARTTKQQARLDRAEDLASEVQSVSERNQSQSVRLSFSDLGRSPKRLWEAKELSKAFGARSLFKDLSFTLGPKSRLGIIGANGSGKSTLLKILLGEETSDTGEVFRSDALEALVFEQNRESLDPNTSLLRTLCPAGDHVIYGGASIHVRGYLDRFLFRPEQWEMPVRQLSGGEQSRLLLARLMLRPSNFLVLDEPTNDLDIDTLNVLEEVLEGFAGGLILISHDRAFLDRVCEQILAIDSEVSEFFAEVSQWERWRKEKREKVRPKKGGAKEKSAPTEDSRSGKDKKLSFKEQRELDQMESNIALAENKVKQLELEAQQVASQASRLLEVTDQLAQAQKEVERLYRRWSELESTAKK